MLPTIDEIAADAEAVAREYMRPPSGVDWSEWYGANRGELEALLDQAAERGALRRITRTVGCQTFKCWVSAKENWEVDTLQAFDVALWQMLAAPGGVIKISMQEIGRKMDVSRDDAWTGIRRLMNRGIVVKVAGVGRAGNAYKVRRFA